MGFWQRAVAAGGALLLVGVVAGGLRRWPVDDPALRTTILGGIEKASGLSITAGRVISLRLLPRPTVELRDVALRGLSGAIALDAEVMRGHLDLLALLGGGLQIGSTGFDSPTIALDADRLGPILTTLRGSAGSAGSLALLHTRGLSLHDGVLRLRSRDPRYDGLLTDLSATVTWPSDTAEASLAGSGTWHGISGDVAVDIARPADALRGGQSLVSARLKSGVLELDAQGVLSGAGEGQAAGKLAASTRDLPTFLRTIGRPAPQLGALHQARLAASVTLSAETLSFDGAVLDLDDMAFEGAMAVRQHDGQTAVAGTWATDRINLDPFTRALPALLAANGGWSDQPLGTRSVAFDEIDLRISASTARIRTFAMDDCSLSLQSGAGRMELSIGEARAYDGLLKARIVATLDGEATDIRADATLSRLDLKGLLKSVPGNYRATGTLSSHIALAARGRTPAELAHDVTGHGQLNLHDGLIGEKLLAAIMRPAPSATLPLLTAIAGAGAFDAALLDAAVDRGAVSFGDSWISWPNLRAEIGGGVDVPSQTANIRATVRPENGQEAAEVEAAYDLRGSWHDLQLKPARPRS